MDTDWEIAAAGMSITVLGWLLTPIIGLLRSKFLSYLGFDASQKLQELEIHIIPALNKTLQEVEEQWMLREAKNETSNVITLNKMDDILRHARDEAEDILDLVNYHRIERKVVGDGSGCVAHWGPALLAATGAASRLHTSFEADQPNYSSGCRSGPCVGSYAGQAIYFLALLHPRTAILVMKTILLVTAGAAASDESVLLTTVVLTNSSVWWLSCWCSSFDLFKNCCRSILYWLGHAIGVACFYRDWSYDVIGITISQVPISSPLLI